jgi:hypothetical protein
MGFMFSYVLRCSLDRYEGLYTDFKTCQCLTISAFSTVTPILSECVHLRAV